MTYAYARVSTKEQNERRQLDAFAATGLNPCVYVDHESGKDFDRTNYKRMRRMLKKGDTLVVVSLDRFGRNYDMIIEEWRYLTKEKGVNIRVLDMPILNSTADTGLTGKLIQDIVLQLLSYVAQSEREAIHKRQSEGIAAAKARGVRFGRERKEVPADFDLYAKMVSEGKIGARPAAKRIGISHTIFYRWFKERGFTFPPREGRVCISNAQKMAVKEARRVMPVHTAKAKPEVAVVREAWVDEVYRVAAMRPEHRYPFTKHWPEGDRRRKLLLKLCGM